MLDKGERWRVVEGDCLDVLRGMPSASVNCCVTSPPYYGLRDYGHAGQLGMEGRHDCAGWATGARCGACYVCRMTAVFDEVRRVLTDDGTCWLNIADSYCHPNPSGPQGKNGDRASRTFTAAGAGGHGARLGPGMKPKDLLLVPARLALSLQAAGWYVRCDIIWAKGNPMPESVTDRPTKAHEYLWLLSKSAAYFYDADAIAEPCTAGDNGSTYTKGKTAAAREHLAPVGRGRRTDKQAALGKQTYTGFNDRWDASPTTSRNKRSVWSVNPRPFPGAHFAVYPPELVAPCVRAGCPVGGVVLDPFTGSGTTGCVAIAEGRRFVGAELNPEYAAMARRRIGNAHPSLFAEGVTPNA